MELGLEFDSDPHSTHPDNHYPSPSSQYSPSDPFDEHSIRVLLRIRPFSDKELSRNDQLSITPTHSNTCIVQSDSGLPPTQLQFDSVFDPSASQEDVYNGSGIDGLIGKAIEGYSVTVFAYGMTSSGKSYTISGPDDSKHSIDPYHGEAGLVSRAVLQLQQHMQRAKEAREGSDESQSRIQMTMKASYYEIYNETVKDLLRPANTSLHVRWSVETGFFVENLFMIDCEVLDDFLVVLEEGLKNRRTGSHNLNAHSSRSHSIMTVYISTVDPEMLDAKGEPVERVGQISFVDLAGSEKVKETKTSGASLTETMNINKSLLTLGSCIAALSDPKKKDKHIPFRDSLLTKLMYDSLGGNGYVLMIACVSPSTHSLSETQSTLRYAQRAKHIKSIPIVKTSDPQEEVITRLKRDLRVARAEMSQVRDAIGEESWDGIVRRGRGGMGRSMNSMGGQSRGVTGNTANRASQMNQMNQMNHAPRNDLFLRDNRDNQQQNLNYSQNQSQSHSNALSTDQSRHQSQDFSDYSYSGFQNEGGDTKYSSDDSFYMYAHPKSAGKGKLTTEKKKKALEVQTESNTTKNARAKR